MSTKAIEEALSRLNTLSPTDGTVGPALQEMKVIRKACRDYSDGIEYGKPVTSGAIDAVELFRIIGQEESQ